MNWIYIVLIGLWLLIFLSTVIKVILRKKLNNIDGVMGIQDKDGSILGCEGHIHHWKQKTKNPKTGSIATP